MGLVEYPGWAKPMTDQRLEADIDYRLMELWTEFPPIEDWDVVIAAAFMRAAYGRGYIDALEEELVDERAKLCKDNGYKEPGR
jgi:hypothetical protein